MMKRILLFALIACFVLSLPCAASAQQNALCGLPLAEDAWYELSEDSAVLTVRLPMEDALSESWHFMIGNENVIELLTCEVLGDEEGETENAMWVGSFRSFGSGGSTVIQFTRAAQDDEILETRLIDLTAAEDASLSILRGVEDSFCRISEDGTALYVSLSANPSTGFSWSYSLSDEEVLLCTAEDYASDETPLPMTGTGGTYTAEFRGTFKKAGFVTLTLNYARPWESVQPIESHTVELFVNEANMLEMLPAKAANAIASGRYEDDGYSHLILTKNADGSYAGEISIYRLTLQDDGKGVFENGVLTLVATDAAGGSMTWTLTPEDGGIKAVVTKSEWSLLPEGETFFFTPVLD